MIKRIIIFFFQITFSKLIPPSSPVSLKYKQKVASPDLGGPEYLLSCSYATLLGVWGKKTISLVKLALLLTTPFMEMDFR